MFLMSLWALVSASICISATTYNQILAGRCLNYVYAVSQAIVRSPPAHLPREWNWSSFHHFKPNLCRIQSEGLRLHPISSRS